MPACFAVLPLMFVALCTAQGASSDGVDEHEMFPTLALKVLKYVEWNGEAKVELGQKIRVGVYDRTRGQAYLKVFASLCEKYPQAYELVDLTEAEVSDFNFDMVYIAGKLKLPLDLLDSLAGKPVLIVGEHAKILEKGGIIRLQVSSLRKPEYGINLKQAKSLGIKIESRLSRGAVELIR
ncbi:YfiR family protein [Pelagicoccus sp. SDUM812005]|uniref:YfiR family protein n=1 Tax=Pelagicoccus sp. SDUM812005 TaxID=3041257 RepID=UPI00280F0744|nr:YfiR family protein [Pelagicoccus sp. SDUM812005]MDQ8182757.1 YfiR family protein [Pelagicoccus sp. SDUM812005]